jgi:hypothetical protein
MPPGLHVMSVGCMDLCPKDAITVRLPASRKAMLSVLRHEDEIDKLYQSG